METYAFTPEGKNQSKCMVESRLALGCTSAKDFYNKYGKGMLGGKDLFFHTLNIKNMKAGKDF
ncbi:MAG: hypothetical protein IJE43_21860 [Alphaproteobacteria bacterium]|nr:hypothetical protein [Alphaproteobacteria bacterium]